MKNFTQAALVLTVAVGVLMSVSCKEHVVQGKGPMATEQRDIASFDKIKIDMPAEATIVIGDAQSVEVEANENLVKHIKTEVSGNTLRIHHEGIWYTNGNVAVSIHMPALKMLDISGAADAAIKGDITGNEFTLEVSGAADVDIEQMDVDDFKAKLSGASKLNIHKGNVKHAVYKVTGAGEIYASSLETRSAEAKVSGAGEMELHVTDELDAHITGAGSIDYIGHPQVTSHIAGVGSLNDAN